MDIKCNNSLFSVRMGGNLQPNFVITDGKYRRTENSEIQRYTLLEKLVNVRKIRHDTSVKFTEQVPYSFFPLVYGIKCVSVTFHRLSIPTEYQVSHKLMPVLPMTELLCNFYRATLC